MKKSKKHTSKQKIGPTQIKSKQLLEENENGYTDLPRRKKEGGQVTDKKQLVLEIEVGICEVDKIFEGQGDKLSDSFVCESLQSLTKLIKENSFEHYAAKLKDGSDDESDMLHINIVNRLSSLIEELEAPISDMQIVEAIKHVLTQVKAASPVSGGKGKHEKPSRAYLDPLAKRLKEMGLKSEFLTEPELEDNTIHLEDIDNLDDLNIDDEDWEDIEPRY
jgi:hypothetical protein